MVLEVASPDLNSASEGGYNERILSALGLPKNNSAVQRADVAIGFVDYGFDLLHPTLRSASGSQSRFRYLWDQNRTPQVERAADLDLARIEDWDGAFLDAEVAAAIASGSRRNLDLLHDPHANNGSRSVTTGGAHGTLMASMAAGTAFGGFQGAAPHAALIGVQLALAEHDWKEQNEIREPTWLSWDSHSVAPWNGWRSYDASPQIISAARYIYDRACRLGVDAVLINLSIGAWAGAHDGRSPVEQAIANLLSRADRAHRQGRGPRTIVVAGAGNAGADEGHWTANMPAMSTDSFDWIMQRRDPTQNKIEIWYEASGADLQIALVSPDGASFVLPCGRPRELVIGGTRVGIAEQSRNIRSGLSCARLLVHPPLVDAALFDGAAGSCAFKLVLRNPARRSRRVHAWVERDDGVGARSWLSPSHPESSLCCLATIPGAVTVAGYDLDQGTSGAGLLPASSLGPAPWSSGAASRVPHFATPAHAIWGARSKTHGFAQTTGTSAAVALTSGAIAAHLAVTGADAPLPDQSGTWNSRLGYGPFRIDRNHTTGARP